MSVALLLSTPMFPLPSSAEGRKRVGQIVTFAISAGTATWCSYAVRDLLSSDSTYVAPLLLQSTGDHCAALRSGRAQGTIALPCTSRACCTSSWVEGAAPRDLVWPLGWRCCRARRLSSRVASCLHQDVLICWRRRGLNKSLPSPSVVASGDIRAIQA